MGQLMGELEPTPLISVIIPCYKGQAFIKDAIASVLRQTYSNFEIIVVDDGSPDQSAQVVQQYLQDSRVKYITQANQGVAAARNFGVRHSSGSCLVFLDQDDQLLPNALEVGLRSLQNHSDCGFVFGQSYMTDAKGHPLIYASLERAAQGVPSCTYEALIAGKGPSICPPSVALFRRDIVEQVGGFNSAFGMADDYDIYLNIVKQVPIYFHGAAIAAYRQHGENNSHHALQMRDDTLKVLNAHKQCLSEHRLSEHRLSEHPHYETAFEAGVAHWNYCFTAIMIHGVVQHFFRGRWGSAFRSGAELVRQPTFPLAVVFYLIWWYNIVQLRLKVRSVRSTEQLLSWMQQSYPGTSAVAQPATELATR